MVGRFKKKQQYIFGFRGRLRRGFGRKYMEDLIESLKGPIGARGNRWLSHHQQ